MTRRIIQDVVFPSKRGKEEPRQSPEPVIPARLPNEHAPAPQLRQTDSIVLNEQAISKQKPQEPLGFLPQLVKKPERGESSSSVWVKNTGNTSNKSSRMVLWTLAAVVFVGMLAVVLSTFFSGATVKIIPLNKTVTLAMDFTARENATEKGIVPYQKIPLPTEEQSEDIPTTLEKKITKKASGKVKIFNEYSTASQRLIKNTRFESAIGKIYRIDNSIVVPGVSTASGKTTPGSIEATVYGDAPGEEYNSSATDFTIPGFKGDPRYTKFYARSQTPIEGGFSGTIKIPSPEDQKSAVDRLKEALRADLVKKAHAQTPEGFILYDNAIFVVFNDLEAINTQNPAHITVKGSLYGIMFNKGALSGFIAEKMINPYDGNPVLVRNLADLELKPKGDVLDPANLKDASFTISGDALVVWDVDMEKLKNELAGVSKSGGFKNIITKYTAIWKAEAVVRPFWKMNFPENSEKITIEEALK
ncbi:MAG: hypothetical protein HZB09_00165 [Candidatus Yonathbacteria bacterium]|nr:hypothetical protein [Candidatus Yonathbacteria bacterium]